MVVDLARRAALDNPAAIHDGDAVAEMADDREVVRDEDQRQVEFLPQADQQVDDLRLDRDVERRDRLVADDDIGLHRQCAGNGDALALPPENWCG